MEDATLIETLTRYSKDRLKLATQALGRRPSTQNINEALFSMDEAKAILIAVERIVIDNGR